MKKTFLLIMTALLAVGTSAALAGCGGDEVSFTAVETTAVSTADSASETTVPRATNATTTAPATTAATKPGAAATTAPTTKPAQTSKSQTTQTNNNTNNTNTNANTNTNNTNNNNNTNTNNNTNNNNNNNSQQNSKITTKPTDPPKQEGSFAASDAVFVYNNRQVVLDSDMDAVLAALGEADSMTSAPSCIGVGEDKTYHYDGFTITTYPRGGKDYVMEVKVLDAAIATAKGVHLGSTVDDMTAAYGSGYRTFGYIYAYRTNDNKSLQFFVEDGVITELSYAYQVA